MRLSTLSGPDSRCQGTCHPPTWDPNMYFCLCPGTHLKHTAHTRSDFSEGVDREAENSGGGKERSGDIGGNHKELRRQGEERESSR